MLIASDRHTAEDLRLWAEYEAGDRLHGATPRMQQRLRDACQCVSDFCADGPAYCSVSWGKDSVAVAELVSLSGWQIPLVWIKVEPVTNPDCVKVRNAFLSRNDMEYHEIVVGCDGRGAGRLNAGFREAERRFGQRHISGVRADESAGRHISCATWGKNTKNSCRPLAWWSAIDVMGFLADRDLPVHPAYAMLGGGRWERKHLRVASLGGERGNQFGRDEWEREYYGDVLRRIEAGIYA